MGRLTKRINGHAHGAEGVSLEKLTGVYCRGEFEATACVEKLAEYEDAEEQGLLLRLPCKVGDIVYVFHTILECEYDYDCQENDAYKCEGGCLCEYEYKVTRIRETQFEIPMIAMLGKSVFLTKAEAEKALAEMG